MTAAPPDQAPKRLKLKRASDVHATKTHFIENGIIPIGTPTILAGPSGIGKTTIVLAYLAKITRGECDGLYKGKPQSVIVLSPEDDEGSITRPRLEAAGADLDRVHFMAATRTTEGGDVDTYVTFPTDIPLLVEAVKQTGAVAVMLDPIASVIEGNLDKREDVRAAFDRLAAEVAREHQLALIMVAHNKKGMDSVRGRVSGSAAITDAARSVLAVAKNPDDNTVVLSVDKSSYSTAEGTNLAFTLTSVDIPLRRGGFTTVARADCIGVTDVSVAQLNSRQDDSTDLPELEGNAMERHIFTYLREAGGSAPANDVIRDGVEQHGFKKDALKVTRSRMRKPAKILSIRSGFGKEASYTWAIDEAMDYSETAMDYMGNSDSKPVTHVTHVQPMEDESNVIDMFKTKESETK